MERDLFDIALMKKFGGGSGGGGVTSWNDLPDKPFYEEDGEVVLAEGEYTSEFYSSFGAYGVGADFNKHIPDMPQTVTVTFDGATYKDLTVGYVSGVGDVFGNLYFLNAIAGTSFPNTGEPFLGGFSKVDFVLFLVDTTPTAHSVKLVAPAKVYHTISQRFIDIPFFDLIEMGLPDIDDSVVSADVDAYELVKALWAGAFVKIRFLYDGQKHNAVVRATINEDTGGVNFSVPLLPFTGMSVWFLVNDNQIGAYVHRTAQ